MKRTLSAVEARRHLGEILEGVYYRGDEIAVERSGKIMGVIVPVEEYRALERARSRLWELVERSWERNRDAPYELIQREVAGVIREVRGLPAEEPDAGGP